MRRSGTCPPPPCPGGGGPSHSYDVAGQDTTLRNLIASGHVADAPRIFQQNNQRQGFVQHRLPVLGRDRASRKRFI